MMSGIMIPISANFDDVEKEIWEGDLVLLRNRKGTCIRAAKVARWDGELFCLDVKKYQGVTAISLEQLVRFHPGQVDVYEVNPLDRWATYDRQGSIRHMKNMFFSKADRRNAVIETLMNLFLRWFSTPNKKIAKTPYGAEAIRMADRLGGGVEPVPDLTTAWVTPPDLGQSPLYRYRFTLK